MLALSSEFTQAQFLGLDKRWELLAKVAHLAKHGSRVAVPTLDAKVPLQSINNPFVLQELAIDVPDGIKEIEAYMLVLEGKHYVCGIGMRTGATHLFIGNKSSISAKFNVAHIRIDIIGSVVDTLGIRGLKFDDSK